MYQGTGSLVIGQAQFYKLIIFNNDVLNLLLIVKEQVL